MTNLENSLDKAEIKYNTACHISKRYKQILEKLKEDSLYMPAKLDAMEAAIIEQRGELKELKSMAKTATEVTALIYHPTIIPLLNQFYSYLSSDLNPKFVSH